MDEVMLSKWEAGRMRFQGVGDARGHRFRERVQTVTTCIASVCTKKEGNETYLQKKGKFGDGNVTRLLPQEDMRIPQEKQG